MELTEAPEEGANLDAGSGRADEARMAAPMEDVVGDWAEPRPARGIDWLGRAPAGAAGTWRERPGATAERRRAGLLVAAALICTVAVAAPDVQRAVVASLRYAGQAMRSEANRPQQARAPAGSRPNTGEGRTPTNEPTAAPTKAPVGSSASTTQPTPAPQLPPYRQTTQNPPAQQQPPPQPQNTPPGSRIVAWSQAGSGWQNHNGGGYGGCDTCFTGGMAWINGPTGATAMWSTNVPSNSVQVMVWVPNYMAGAVVNYTITGAQQYPPIPIKQEWVIGWQTLPQTFAPGSNGTIKVVASYVAVGAPQSTPDPACLNNGTYCSAMAAAQVQFKW